MNLQEFKISSTSVKCLKEKKGGAKVFYNVDFLIGDLICKSLRSLHFYKVRKDVFSVAEAAEPLF